MIDPGDGTLRFSSLAGIRHAVSTRAIGDLKTLEGRERFAHALGVPPAALVRGRQVHDCVVAMVDASSPPVIGDGDPRGADALATCVPGRVLLTLAADCAPVVLVDPVARAVAIAHAGWRGAVLGIAGLAARVLVERLDARPERLLAAIGPCIGPCCFEVGADVAEPARARPGGAEAVWADRERPEKSRLDLAALVRADLLAAGVPGSSIEHCDLCTRCRQDLFFSHRGSGTSARIGVAVGIV